MERHLWIWRGENKSDERANHVFEFLNGFAATVAPCFSSVFEKDEGRICVDLIFGHEVLAGSTVDLENVSFVAYAFAKFVENVVHGTAAFFFGIIEFHKSGFGVAQCLNEGFVYRFCVDCSNSCRLLYVTQAGQDLGNCEGCRVRIRRFLFPDGL